MLAFIFLRYIQVCRRSSQSYFLKYGFMVGAVANFLLLHSDCRTIISEPGTHMPVAGGHIGPGAACLQTSHPFPAIIHLERQRSSVIAFFLSVCTMKRLKFKDLSLAKIASFLSHKAPGRLQRLESTQSKSSSHNTNMLHLIALINWGVET